MRIDSFLSICSWQVSLGLFCIIFILFIFVKLIALITGYHFIGIILIFLGMYFLLKLVGQFALFPGSFSYIRSEIQINTSKRIAQQTGYAIQKFYQHLQFCSTPQLRNPQPPEIYAHIEDMIGLFSKFQGHLSPPKQELLERYRQLNEYLNSQHEFKDVNKSYTIRQFLTNPKAIKHQINNSQSILTLINQIKNRSGTQINRIGQLIMSFSPPAEQGLVGSLSYKFSSEKLFELRFAYYQWDSKFIYDHYEVKTEDNQLIQFAVIHKLKNDENIGENKENTQKKQAVILSCPNGAYIQFYVFDCRHVYFYLQMGFQVIIWNYRGYGSSTGAPSLSASLKDIQTVYDFCRGQLGIQPTIAHGYSVGGPPSVHLAAKHSNQIKLLIVDRSFSHVYHIANELSPVLGQLYKLLFSTDAKIKNSEAFLSIKDCFKLLIWDYNDQIVSDASSLKRQIMVKMFQQKYGSIPTKHQQAEQNKNPNETQQKISPIQLESALSQQLNPTNSSSKRASNQLEFDSSEDQIDTHLKIDTKSIPHILHNIKSKILQFYIEQRIGQNMVFSLETQNTKQPQNQFCQLETEEMMNEKIEEQQLKVGSKLNAETFLQDLFDSIKGIDGGGIFMFNYEHLKGLVTPKNEQGVDYEAILIHLHTKILSFTLGIILFGSYYQDSGKVIEQNCLFLYQARLSAIQKMKAVIQQLQGEQQDYTMAMENIVKKFIKVCKKIKAVLEHTLDDSNRDQQFLGTLLPTKVGHNGELQPCEYDIITKAIQNQFA